MSKLILDESLFEDADIPAVNLEEPVAVDEEDIEISEAPTGQANGVADELMNLIKDEYEAVQGYHTFLATIDSLQEFANLKESIEHIAEEEQKHIGELTSLLELVSPNATKQEEGKEEAKQELGGDIL